MTPARRFRKSRLLAAVMAAMVIGHGCETAEYDKQLQRWQKAPQAGGAVAAPGSRVDVPGVPATFVPPSGMRPVDIAADPRRGRPPNADDLPGLLATYEGSLLDGQQGKQHYYCYLISAYPAPDAVVLAVNCLQGVIKGSAKWNVKSVDAQGPDGKPVKLRQYSAAGPQDFHYVSPSGEGLKAEMDGLLQVWDREVRPDGAHLLVVWRVPVSIAGKQYVDAEDRGKALAASIAPK